jgi:5'(3')-deoxyribonucleotidase
MKLGIDMDDVLCDFQKRFVALLHGMYGRPPINTAPIDWNWSNCEVSAEEMKAAWAKAATVRNLWAYLEPLPSFDYETVLLLQDANSRHDLFFVTNRFDTPGLSPTKQTKAWLVNSAHIDMPSVFIAKDKGPMAQVLELDAFIDDRPKNVLDVIAARPSARVYLCDSSHNKDFNDPRVPRVKDLKEFLKLILEAN